MSDDEVAYISAQMQYNNSIVREALCCENTETLATERRINDSRGDYQWILILTPGGSWVEVGIFTGVDEAY